jgi:PEP-CTERM motif
MFRFSKVFKLLSLVIALGAAPLAVIQAAPFEFADVNLLNANLPFTFTNNGGTSGTVSILSAPVTFNFTTQSGLSTVDHQATLTLQISSAFPPGTPSTFTPGSQFGPVIDQPLPNLMSLSITEVGTGANLLTMLFTGDIVGRAGTPNGNLSGADNTGQAVQFSSAFGSFLQPGNSFVLGLGTITPGLTLGPGNFLNSFTSNINGQFTANFSTVPEPAATVLFGLGIAAAAIVRVRRFSRLG